MKFPMSSLSSAGRIVTTNAPTRPGSGSGRSGSTPRRALVSILSAGAVLLRRGDRLATSLPLRERFSGQPVEREPGERRRAVELAVDEPDERLVPARHVPGEVDVEEGSERREAPARRRIAAVRQEQVELPHLLAQVFLHLVFEPDRAETAGTRTSRPRRRARGAGRTRSGSATRALWAPPSQSRRRRAVGSSASGGSATVPPTGQRRSLGGLESHGRPSCVGSTFTVPLDRQSPGDLDVDRASPRRPRPRTSPACSLKSPGRIWCLQARRASGTGALGESRERLRDRGRVLATAAPGGPRAGGRL